LAVTSSALMAVCKMAARRDPAVSSVDHAASFARGSSHIGRLSICRGRSPNPGAFGSWITRIAEPNLSKRLNEPGSTALFCLRKPSKQFMCKLRKRIVARAHDYNSIGRTRKVDQSIAAGVAVRKDKRFSPSSFDVADNVVASNAAVD